MKVNSSIIAAFVAGAVLASLPYTLSSGKTVAQGAGPNQGGGQGQGFPPQGGQGFPGQGQGQIRQGQFQMPGQAVNSMTASGNFLFAAAGDTIYKIEVDSMRVVGQAKLPAPRPQNQGGGQGQAGGVGRPGQGIRGGGTGTPPPSSK